jgi:hypothetical protein
MVSTSGLSDWFMSSTGVSDSVNVHKKKRKIKSAHR